MIQKINSVIFAVNDFYSGCFVCRGIGNELIVTGKRGEKNT